MIKHCIFAKHFSEAGQTQDPGPHTAAAGSRTIQLPWLLGMGNGTLCLSPLKSAALEGHRSALAEPPLPDSRCCSGTGARAHRCPHGWLPVSLTLRGTPVRRPGVSGHREGQASLTWAQTGQGWIPSSTQQKPTPCPSRTCHSHKCNPAQGNAEGGEDALRVSNAFH